MDITSYHIEKVSNGYIVSEASPQRDMSMMKFAVSTRPPHVFETFDAMSKWLSNVLESKAEKPAS